MKAKSSSRSLFMALGASAVALAVAPVVARGEGPASAQFVPAAPASSAPVAGPTSSASLPHEHPLHVTWHTLDTLEQVNAASTLVVHATVVSQRRGMMRAYGWNQAAQRQMTPAEAGSEFTETPLTISTLQIIDVVRGKQAIALGGKPAAAGSLVELVELGGQLMDGCFTAPGDKPVLHAREEGVYFLSPTERPGAYNVVGGWQGRMGVVNGSVRSLASDVHPDASQFTRHTGRDVASFKDEVRRLPVP